MNDQSQLLIRAIRGPVIMITIGVLFAADRFTDYRFHQTWPALLIVLGLMQLLGGRRRRDYYPTPQSPGATPGTNPGQTASTPAINHPFAARSGSDEEPHQ